MTSSTARDRPRFDWQRVQRTSRPIIASLSAALVACTSDPDGAADRTSLTLPVGRLDLVVGNILVLQLPSGGSPANPDGRTAAWESTRPSIVSVSRDGLVSARAAGEAVIRFRSGSEASEIPVRVYPKAALNFGWSAIRFVQSVQNEFSAIPLIAGGLPAVANFYLVPTVPNSVGTRIRLEVFDAAGRLRFAESTATGPLAGVPDPDEPSAQILVPANVLVPGARWRAVSDPTTPDADPADDIQPPRDTGPLTVLEAEPLSLHVIPIGLPAQGGAPPAVTEPELTEQLHFTRRLFPLGPIIVTREPPLSLPFDFGTAPVGADTTFWNLTLQALDLARIAGGADPGQYWIGLVAPPPGFREVEFAGVAYVGGRSAVMINAAWFQTGSAGRVILAHELGHNFGRLHAPCGSPANPDPEFPNAGAVTGTVGFDVLSDADRVGRVPSVPATAHDIMSYCSPFWISEYTWQAVLQYRANNGHSGSREEAPRSLLVQGTIGPDGSVTLAPAFAMNAGGATAAAGDYRVVARDAAGQPLASARVAAQSVDHAPGIRHFTALLPVTPTVERRITTLEVAGLTGPPLAVARSPQVPDAALSSGPAVEVAPVPSDPGVVAVSCQDRSTRRIMIRSAGDGRILAVAPGRQAILRRPAPGTVQVLCSDGVQTKEASLSPP
ncbi:MAG: hypothetical protein AB7L66_06390 [Gemmatimonadales bacterium]